MKIVFDEHSGICSGCEVHQEKYVIDWEARRSELFEIFASKRVGTSATYDCVVPVVGNGDDYFLVDFLKNTMGVNPLLVTYNSHFSTKVGIRNLARLITSLDCEHIQMSVGPATVKGITRFTLQKIGDVYWHVQAGMQAFATQTAVKLKIPIIVWPVNGWMDQIGKFSHFDRVEMTRKIWEEFALRSLSPYDIYSNSASLTKKDFIPFEYPTFDEIEGINLRGLFLNNYLFWDAKLQTESMIKKYGFEPRAQSRTFNSYETAHCWVNADVQDYLKHLKFGYSKVHDHASRDLRLGRLTRVQAEAIAEYFEFQPMEALEAFLGWTGLSEDQFFQASEKFRNPKIWQNIDGNWMKSNKNGVGGSDMKSLVDPDVLVPELNKYQVHKAREAEFPTKDFILTGRTYIDEYNYNAIGDDE